jgi:hypothetical protein
MGIKKILWPIKEKRNIELGAEANLNKPQTTEQDNKYKSKEEIKKQGSSSGFINLLYAITGGIVGGVIFIPIHGSKLFETGSESLMAFSKFPMYIIVGSIIGLTIGIVINEYHES